ncbi:GNAT family N-acetyltransferase [Thalassobaculum sp.]|uniref:GNAT family N-acetyltransferase n=1 Tax=Thalassobaculum sp. TaxID=2022740 RepID=UPI0032EE6ED9
MSIDLVPYPADEVETLVAWVAAPHVVRWWKPSWSAPVIDAFRAEDTAPSGIRPWRVDLDGHPIGYVQDYDVAQDDSPWAGVDDVGPGTRGVDLLIGDPGLINRKHGRMIIRTLATRLFTEHGVSRLVSGPHPDNWPAIIAFKRAGFRERGRRQFPEGPAMILTAAKAVWSA